MPKPEPIIDIDEVLDNSEGLPAGVGRIRKLPYLGEFLKSIPASELVAPIYGGLSPAEKANLQKILEAKQARAAQK